MRYMFNISNFNRFTFTIAVTQAYNKSEERDTTNGGKTN